MSELIDLKHGADGLAEKLAEPYIDLTFDLKQQIACLISELRTKAGLTQEELAQQSGCSTHLIHNCEHPEAKLIKLLSLVKIIRVFNKRIVITAAPRNDEHNHD